MLNNSQIAIATVSHVTDSRIAGIISQYLADLQIARGQAAAAVKRLRASAGKAIAVSDWPALQTIAPDLDSAQTRIQKIDRAFIAFEKQARAISDARRSFAMHGSYILTNAQALTIVGDLSDPSKMPCFGYSLPAAACILGQKYAGICGSVCSKCYASHGNYSYIEVKANLFRRLIAVSDLDLWYAAMCQAIAYRYRKTTNKKSKQAIDLGYFRIHDSGDLQSVAHLQAIAKIARTFPSISFWLPSKQINFVRSFLASETMPANLIVRISAPMIGQVKPQPLPLRASAVNAAASEIVHVCHVLPKTKDPIHKQCGDCRQCWNNRIAVVSYHAH